jgi:dihydrofolate reductase
VTSSPYRSLDPTPAADSRSPAALGPILVAGSATVEHTPVESDLVDERRLTVFPVAIDGGLRVFPRVAPEKPFKLTETFDPAGKPRSR